MDRPRFYDAVLAAHFAQNRQMAWINGPRQVGKTTCCRKWGEAYLNWDAIADRRLLLLGPAALASHLSLERLRDHPVRLVLDELPKHTNGSSYSRDSSTRNPSACKLPSPEALAGMCSAVAGIV